MDVHSFQEKHRSKYVSVQNQYFWFVAFVLNTDIYRQQKYVQPHRCLYIYNMPQMNCHIFPRTTFLSQKPGSFVWLRG